MQFQVSAPGKVILLGEHSVVYGKTALAASFGRRTTLLFDGRNSSDKIHLLLPLVDVNQWLQVADVCKLLDLPLPVAQDNHKDYNWKRPDLIQVDLMTTQIREFMKGLDAYPFNHGQECALIAFFFLLRGIFATVAVDLGPFSMEITSELAVGAGTGSSASYGVCLAAALYHYFRCRVVEEGVGQCVSKDSFKPSEIDLPDLKTFNKDEIEIILSWALVSDGIMHGNPSGVDATVITHGKIITFQRGEGGAKIVQLPAASAMNVMLVNSGITRDTKRMVDGVAQLRGRFPQIIDLVLEAMHQVALAAAAILTASPSADGLTSKLAELMTINQSLLCSLGVSHPSLDNICHIARSHGLSAKLTGAGGGGYAIILLPPSLNVDTLRAALESAGYHAVIAVMGGDGVLLHHMT